MAETNIVATGEEFFASTAQPTAPTSSSSSLSLSSSAASSSIPKIKYQSDTARGGSFDSSMFASSSIPTILHSSLHSKRPTVQSSASLHSSALLHSKLTMHINPSLQPQQQQQQQNPLQFSSMSTIVQPQQPHPQPPTEPNKPLQEFQDFLSQNKFASESEKISRLLCRLNHGQAVWRFEATDRGDGGEDGYFWDMPGSMAFRGIVRYDSDGGEGTGEEATVHYEDALVIVEKIMKVASSSASVNNNDNDNDNDLLHCLVEPVSVFPSSHQHGDQRNLFKFILLSSHLLLVKK
jgi:hypothetical protein